MKTFTFEVEITQARGHQVFKVEADNVQDALKFLRAGQGEITDEHIEVTSLNMLNPRLTEETMQ